MGGKGNGMEVGEVSNGMEVFKWERWAVQWRSFTRRHGHCDRGGWMERMGDGMEVVGQEGWATG